LRGIATQTPAVFLFVVFCIANAYFFQGGNWNQNGRFDTTRAIVERGEVDIGQYQNTRDITTVNGKIYLNKPLGISVLGVPVYFILYHVEKLAHLSPDHPLVITANAHVLAFFTSGLPAAILVVLLFQFFRRQGLSTKNSSLLAAGFGFGSLLLPYSGAMMAHNAVACLLFAAWMILSFDSSSRTIILAGLLVAYAFFCDYMAAPVALFFLTYSVWRYGLIRSSGFLIGPLLMGIGVLAIQQHYFGGIFTTPYASQTAQFSDPNLVAGMFEIPRPLRIYWLTIHPFRGLFYCCPLFLLPLLAPFSDRPIRGVEPLLSFGVFLYFLVATAAFNGWHGGTCFGPRYLIPGLPFLYSLSAFAFPRFRIFGYIVIFVSAFLMMVVSVTSMTIPLGLPDSFNPLSFIFSHFLKGQISISNMGMYEIKPTLSQYDFWESYNLGELLGLRGIWSLIPYLLLFTLTQYFIQSQGKKS
jgi:hypothetical protein